VLSASDWDFSKDGALSAPAPAIDGMTTGNISDSGADEPAAGLALAADIRLPSDISLFHPF
jgi:hypothetical protein